MMFHASPRSLSRPVTTRALPLCALSLWAMTASASAAPAPAPPAAPEAEAPYTTADFALVRKFDAHVHVNTRDPAFIEEARADQFDLLSINVDYPDFPPLKEQAAIADEWHTKDPQHFNYATTFAMAGWTKPGWADAVNASLSKAVADGAVAVKIWKNVGMVERTPDGGWLTINDPVFDPVMARIAELHVPLIAHQAEPLNAWLPLDKMTTENDRSYFAAHPQYHMFRHPEQPGYEILIAQRNQFVARHPEIPFVGAHLASVEWSVDRIARFLDAYPNAVVDMAARMTQLQYQSLRDRPRVLRFLLQYQDRILYGSDLTADAGAPAAAVRKEARDFWRSDWRYLATQDTQTIAAIKSKVPGLALPREVVRKIYFDNAQREFLQRAAPAAARDPAAAR